MCLPLYVAAQLVQPVKWSGEEMGDSVRLKAVIDPGFHMSIIEFGDFEYDDEYVDSFVVTLAKTELTPIRFNACDDKMCTAPEVWEYEEKTPLQPSPQGRENISAGQDGCTDSVTGNRSLWLIFLLGLLGGLLAIFTPCVWPIIPMTVSFFLKKAAD